VNVTEANAVNTVLDFICDVLPDANHLFPDVGDGLRDACVVLADAANRKLMAGWTGDDVRKALQP
jgi:hypothetical protein